MLNILNRIRLTGMLSERPPKHDASVPETDSLQHKLQAVFGRALRIRHLDAGSCNGCELEIHALSNPYYNLEGTGIAFVASPRHADVLLVTGPVTVNMVEALERTYAAIPDPKWVMAVGDCAACGGVFGASYATRGRVNDVIPVDITVNGCPPDPVTILAGLLEITRRHPV